MSAEVAAAKAVVAVASDKRGRIAIVTILCLVRLIEGEIPIDKFLLYRYNKYKIITLLKGDKYLYVLLLRSLF